MALYWPQIYKNYRLKSGDGLSIYFVYILLLSDLYGLIWVLIIVKLNMPKEIAVTVYVSGRSLL